MVALAGTGPDGAKAGIAVAVSRDLTEKGVSADALARPAAKALGGGVGKGTEAVVGGGPNAAGIDDALQLVRDATRDPGAVTAPGRVLGVDLGSVRIGLALSDPSRTVASPHSVLRRAEDHAADHRAILAIAREHDVTTVVVGLPISLSGGKGPAATAAAAEIAELQAAAGAGMEVIAHDERLTTVSAERSLDEAGVRGRDRTAVVDKVAAAIMLQSWLESPRA